MIDWLTDGGGDRFLWRCARGTVDVYKWTGRNEYVALCEPEYLSFGGGCVPLPPSLPPLPLSA